MQDGGSALILAARWGKVDVCRLLVAEKANIDLTNQVKKNNPSVLFYPLIFFPLTF